MVKNEGHTGLSCSADGMSNGAATLEKSHSTPGCVLRRGECSWRHVHVHPRGEQPHALQQVNGPASGDICTRRPGLPHTGPGCWPTGQQGWAPSMWGYLKEGGVRSHHELLLHDIVEQAMLWDGGWHICSCQGEEGEEGVTIKQGVEEKTRILCDFEVISTGDRHPHPAWNQPKETGERS
jgi:hypothetical protein